MKTENDPFEPLVVEAAEGAFAELSRRPVALVPSAPLGAGEAGVGVVVGIDDDGFTPLVTYAGMSGAGAIRAHSVVDVHGSHIGRQVVLWFLKSDHVPVVMGVLRDGTCPGDIEQLPGRVDVTADGKRMTVVAKEQLVLRCGKASITLTNSGKVLIEGAYVSSRSSGLARIRGASVEIN
jgi:hypothetical protein